MHILAGFVCVKNIITGQKFGIDFVCSWYRRKEMIFLSSRNCFGLFIACHQFPFPQLVDFLLAAPHNCNSTYVVSTEVEQLKWVNNLVLKCSRQAGLCSCSFKTSSNSIVWT